MTRQELLDELEAQKREMTRCTGGVDPEGCVHASKRIAELRNLLRDNQAFVAHLQRVVDKPEPTKRSTK